MLKRDAFAMVDVGSRLGNTPDELLAVVAHEIEHIHHRQGIEVAV